MKQYLLLLRSSDFVKNGNVWTSNPINVYSNNQYKNYSYTRSAAGLNLIGDRTFVGTELTSPSYEDQSTPISDYAVYKTDVGEVVYEPATPEVLRFIDTSSRVDLLSYKYTFTNIDGTIVPSTALTVFESDDGQDPWLRSSTSIDSNVILVKNCKQFIKLELTITADGIDTNDLGLLLYLELGIHDPISPVLSGSVKNIAKRFPTWTAIFEDSIDQATPELFIPQSTGGKFLTALLQENLEKFNSTLEINDVNSYINSANENMIAWIYVSYNVPQNVTSIFGDSIELARSSSFADMISGRATDYSFYYSPIDKQLITLRKFSVLLINEALYEQEAVNIFNDFDEFGSRVGLPRLYLEGNSNYKKRILDVTSNMPGVSLEAFKRTVRRELDLWRAYGSTPDSNYLGATPEVLEITDIVSSTPYFTESGKPEKVFRNLVDTINTKYPSNLGYVRWNDGMWDYSGRIGEGVSRIPAVYDSTSSPIGEYYQSGVGDFDDLNLSMFAQESATTSFNGYINITGFRTTDTTEIYPPIFVDYSWYFGYLRTVSDTDANEVGVSLVYEICLPPHRNYSTPSVFYANLNYTNRSDFYVTNYFLSSSESSPEYSYINIFDNEGISELDFRHKVYGEPYYNSSTTPVSYGINIADAASVNVIFGQEWSVGSQAYSSLAAPQFRAAFSTPNSLYYVNPAFGATMSMASPNLHPNSVELKIGSTKYITKQQMFYTDHIAGSQLVINGINDLSTTSSATVNTSDLMAAMALPLDATPMYMYIEAATPNLPYFGEETIRFEQGAYSIDPTSGNEYLIPSSPSVIWSSYNSVGEMVSTPDYFDNITFDINNVPDYLSLKSFTQNADADAFDLMSQAVLWLDPSFSRGGEQVMKNYGTGGSALDAVYGGSISSGSVDPKLLTFDGTKYLYLPGVSGNSARTPDTSPLDITGDIEFIVRVKASDWTPLLDQALVTKWQTGTTRSYALYLATTGALAILTSTNGTAITTQLSSVPGFENNKTYWIKANLDVNNGSGSRVYSFYYSKDQNVEPTSWTLISTHTVAGITNIFSSSSQLEIGSITNGTTDLFAGNIYKIKVNNGINGTTVFDANFTTGISNGNTTSFTESSANAATVTIARSTSSTAYKSVCVTRPTLLFGGDDYLEIVDNNLLDFGTSESFSAVVVHRHWQTFNTNDVLIAKKTDTTSSVGWALTSSNATASQMRAIISDGSVQVGSTTQLQRTSGTMHMATLVRDVSADNLRAFGDTLLTGTTGSDTTTGTLSNSEAVRIGRLSGAGLEYAVMELYAVLVFRKALSLAERTLIYNYYMSDPDYEFYQNINTFNYTYPFARQNYAYFEANTTPNIYYGFIDEFGNAHKNQQEYENSFVMNDSFLSSISVNKNSFGLSTPSYIVDGVKFVTDKDYINVSSLDNKSLISDMSTKFGTNESLDIDLYAVRDDLKNAKYLIGINTGLFSINEKDKFIYNSPITDTYNGKFFELLLSKQPRMGSPIIANVGDKQYRYVAFEDSATPENMSFWNKEYVNGNRGNSLYLAYENVKNISIKDTYTGLTLFNNLSTSSNVISPFSSATPSVLNREYEVLYYVNDAFYVDKEVYNSSTDEYQSKAYFSTTPSSNSNYEITYESGYYNRFIDTELTINEITSSLDRGFIYIDENSYGFSDLQTQISPSYVSDSGGDYLFLSMTSIDENSNLKPHQTFLVQSEYLDVISDSELIEVNVDGSAYVTTNENGFACVAMKYAGAYPATARSGQIQISGIGAATPNGDLNSESQGFVEVIDFDIVRNLAYNLEVKAMPARLSVAADGVTSIPIVGRIYWRGIPLRANVNLAWNKARTLYDLFSVSPTNVISTDSEGIFVIDGDIIAESNTNPGVWFVRIQITNTAAQIELLLPEGEVSTASDITISGDIVYWNEKYDNVHYANEELPLSLDFTYSKQENSDLIATPNFVYSHHNGLSVKNIAAAPNWSPPKWVYLRRFDQYQMGIFGSTPNYIADYSEVHPDAGEE